MFDFLNTLFLENGFIKVAYDEMQFLTGVEGPFDWMYEGEGKAVYKYLGNTGGEQSLDPDYDSYKDSRLIIYTDNPQRTVKENLNDNIFREYFKNDIITKIQKEYEDASQSILEVRKNGKNFKPVVKTIAEEKEYFKKEFALRSWSSEIPYVADEIYKIEKRFSNKYGNIMI